jgi:hypothetical protein
MALTHPRLAHALMALRPGSQFVVQDDGAGPYLRSSNIANLPTQAELDAVTVAQLNQAQASKRMPLSARLASLGIDIAELRAAVASGANPSR